MAPNPPEILRDRGRSLAVAPGEQEEHLHPEGVDGEQEHVGEDERVGVADRPERRRADECSRARRRRGLAP